jgi:hypothetical protein
VKSGSRGGFRLLLGFHVLYSQALLHSAKLGVMKTPTARGGRER